MLLRDILFLSIHFVLQNQKRVDGACLCLGNAADSEPPPHQKILYQTKAGSSDR